MTTIKLDIHSSGGAITVAPGDRLDLHLEETASTGFRWYIENDDSGVLVLEKESSTLLHPGVAGAGGTRDFVLAVAKQGQATLRASKYRSWEKQPPQETFQLTVTAK